MASEAAHCCLRITTLWKARNLGGDGACGDGRLLGYLVGGAGTGVGGAQPYKILVGQ